MELLRHQPGASLPRFRRARAVDASVRELQATEHRADVVLMLESEVGKACGIVFFEVQRRIEHAKLGRWPRYLAVLHDDHRRVPVLLVVVAPTAGVARWARRPIDLGPTMRLTPLVLGPSDVPRVQDVPTTERTATLAVLSAAIHVRTLEEWDALGAAVPAPPRGLDDIGGLAGDAHFMAAVMHPRLKVRLEDRMRAGKSDSLYDIVLEMGIEPGIERGIERGIEKGRTEGRTEGALEATRRLLFELARERGWRMPATQKRRIEACRDPDVLASWVKRLFTARTLGEALTNCAAHGLRRVARRGPAGGPRERPSEP